MWPVILYEFDMPALYHFQKSANPVNQAFSTISVTKNSYDKHCQDPYGVIIQYETNISSSSSIDPLNIGRLLSSTIKKDILEIKKTGYSKITVQLKFREAANNLINNPILK